MTSVAGAATSSRDSRDELLSEFLRTSRELIITQREVMLAYFRGPTGDVPVRAATTAYHHQPAPLAAPPALVEAPAPAAITMAPAARPPAAVEAAAVPALAPDFQSAVLAVISERTGYPVDLIDLDLDLEADLSIDSIKRAEVAGEVAVRLQLTGGEEDELEDLVKARTVRAMVSWLNGKVAATSAGGW